MMRVVNMHEAKTNLSMLVEKAVTHGEPFVIAKAGKPMVKVTPVRAEARATKRIGFMKGRICVPDDFDTMFSKEIEDMFSGDA